MKVDHIAVGVKDLENVLSLLEKNFGFKVLRRGMLHGASNPLAFVQDQATGLQFELVDLPEKQEPTFMHLALQVNDVDAEVEKFRRQGLIVEKEPHDIRVAGIRSALLDTRLGIKVQLLSYR